jgi:lipopolysaccharide biosynthesis regulator YciM
VLANRAVELDPLSLLMNMTPGLTSYLARDYERANTILQKVIEMEPNFPAAHSVLGGVNLQRGLHQQAIDEYRKVLELSNGAAVVETAVKAMLAHVYASWGKRNKANEILEEVTKAPEAGIPLSSHSIAEIH